MKILVVSLLAFFSFAANAADLKVGVVKVEKILSDAPQVEAINAEMLKRFSGRKDELKVMEDEIKKLQEDYKRNELVMTQDKLDEIKNKAISKLQTFKQKEAVLNQEVNTMRNQKLAELQQTIRDIIDGIAKTGDFDLVLSDGVVFADDKLDITGKVLDKMKKDFK